MVPKSLGVKSALELDGASVCVQTGTTTELNLADYFRANNMSYTPVVFERPTKRAPRTSKVAATPTPPISRACTPSASVWPTPTTTSCCRK